MLRPGTVSLSDTTKCDLEPVPFALWASDFSPEEQGPDLSIAVFRHLGPCPSDRATLKSRECCSKASDAEGILTIVDKNEVG